MGTTEETQGPSTPVSAPQERNARSWGPRVSRARPTERNSSAPRVPGNAREPSSAQDDSSSLVHRIPKQL